MNASDTTSNELFAKWQALPPSLQQQVLDFIEFLLGKYGQAQKDEKSLETQESASKLPEVNGSSEIAKPSRILGLYQGKGWISDDFNDPLPDDFWLGVE